MSELIAYFNNETGDQEVRQMTNEELVDLENTRQSFAQEKAEREENEKQLNLAKQAVLAKLGLTLEEAQVLIS
jgi:hypothetical protein